MERILRTISNGLAIMFGLNPRQRALAVLLAVAGLVTLNWFSSASLSLLAGRADLSSIEWWIALLSLPGVFVIFVVASARAWQTQGPGSTKPLTLEQRPEPSKGLVLFLSTYTTFPDKLPNELREQRWTSDDLINAINSPDCNWLSVLDHVQASNMQVPLEAVQYHGATLKHVWLITTEDTPDADPARKARPGSKHLAKPFERIAQQVVGKSVKFHYSDPSLVVNARDLQESFDAVNEVLFQAAPRFEIRERELIADFTSGTVNMSAGMLLACVLYGRRLQFTATDRDPHDDKPLARPTPYAVKIDEDAIRRQILRFMADQPDVQDANLP